ncbi:hypothetical protein B0H12DRAFT_1017342, partial [Mycena haematopus]
DDFPKALFEAATSTSARRGSVLAVSGKNVEEVALALVAEIKAAIANNNFASILAPDRTFKIIRNDNSVVSVGRGIEREAIYIAFRCFTDHPERWFLPRFNDRASITTTMPLSMASFVAPDRSMNLSILGCLTSLLLIHGVAPEPLGPAFIQYAANDCNLKSLTQDFVGEWHPELKSLLEDWIAAGPTGDITQFQAHFATWHDLQIASLQSRDVNSHNVLATEMLYVALIGPQPSSHDEIKAFLTGLKLGCVNGFDFMQVLRSYPGGSSTFISRTWTSIIRSFESLRPHLLIVGMAQVHLEQFVELGHPVFELNLRTLLENFLQGTGAPCPRLFEEAKPCLSKLIPFEKVDSPAFRSMVLCWAATGSPHVEFDEDQQLSVHFVGPNDLRYHDDARKRAVWMKQGLISFHTCFREARIPTVHLVDLYSQTYPSLDHNGEATEPFTLQQAVDNWLLIQILSGIGRHSIL